MEMLRVLFAVMAIFALVLALVVPSLNAQSPAPAPPPTSDGLFSSLCFYQVMEGKQYFGVWVFPFCSLIWYLAKNFWCFGGGMT